MDAGRCFANSLDTLTASRTLVVRETRYPRLLHGQPEERDNCRLIGQGEGIHRPDLDGDISAENILLGQPSGENQLSLSCWLQTPSAPRQAS